MRQPQVLARAAEHVLKFIHNAGEDLVAAEIADRSAASIGSRGISSVHVSDGRNWLSCI